MTAPAADRPAPTTSPATATPAQLLFGDLDAEIALTRRVLERVPDAHHDWRPHERSTTLGGLAGHLAELPRFATMIAAADEFDFGASGYTPPPPAPTAEMVRRFDEESARMRAVVEAMTWDDVGRAWRMRAGDQVFVEGPKAQVLRSFGLSHIAHHRAQLGVYLRLLGVPVPSVYGPTADES